ncbi:MAG: desaturase, partial [Myxococcota bacterium]
AAGDASDRFFQAKLDFPPEGFFGRWGFKRKLSGFPGLDKDSPLPAGSLLSRLTPWLASVDAPGPLTRARVLGRTLAGPALFQGGREGLWSVFAERARELGADVLAADEAVAWLSFEGSSVGVRLARGDTVYRAGFVLAATDLDVLTRLVPEKHRAAAAKAPLKATKACVTFHAVLPERGLPRGLGPLALVDAPQLEGGLVLLQVGAGPKEDQRVLSATVQAPLALRSGGEPAIRALAVQVHAAIARVMPFTRPHVTLESTPWIDAPAIVEGRAEVHPLFTLPADAWLGVAGLTTSSPWKRVLLASRQVLPGLGFEGEVLAAQRAVKSVETALKKNDPLKKGKPA